MESELCPGCGDKGELDGGASYWHCGSHDRRGFFYQSDLCEARKQLAAATKRAKAFQAAYEHDTAKLQQEIQRLTAANSGVYWRWQGDGGDYLESITCPILIDVGQLHEILSKLAAETKRADEAELARDEAVREVERLREGIRLAKNDFNQAYCRKAESRLVLLQYFQRDVLDLLQPKESGDGK